MKSSYAALRLRPFRSFLSTTSLALAKIFSSLPLSIFVKADIEKGLQAVYIHGQHYLWSISRYLSGGAQSTALNFLSQDSLSGNNRLNSSIHEISLALVT